MKKSKFNIFIVLIISMISFFNCTKQKENQIPEKKMITYYPTDFYKNIPKQYINTAKTYMDIYTGKNTPEGEQISFKDLYDWEKEEFIDYTTMKQKSGSLGFSQIKIISQKGKRKLIAGIYHNYTKNDGRDNSVDFSSDLDLFPTFPGCGRNDEDCFKTSVKNHFFEYFNWNIFKEMELKNNNLKINLHFTVANNGHIVYAFGTSNNKQLLIEIERVLNLLPVMTPAKESGKTVAVKYSIPLTIIAE